MNRFVCAAVLLTVLPGFTGTGAVPLVTPLNKSVEGYSSIFSYSPKLNLNLAKTNEPLQKALLALDRDDPPPTLDEINLVVSALKAANEDQALQPYLEAQLGYSIVNVRAWLKQNVQRTYVQKGFKEVTDQVDRAKRGVIGYGVIGLGAGTGILAIPLAFTGVGLVPAFMLAGLSANMLATGAAILAGPQNASVIENAMPDLMTAMLGPEQSLPGARVDWKRASYAPAEELIKRLRHATLAQKAFAALGTSELAKLSNEELSVLNATKELFARDVVHIQMLLAVLSRQLDEGKHLNFAAGLIAALPSENLAPLLLAARATADAPEPFLGISGYVSNDLRDGRRREVTHFGRWVEAALIARANRDVDGPDVLLMAENILGEDAVVGFFNDERAKPKLDQARSNEAVAPPKQRDRLLRMMKRMVN